MAALMEIAELVEAFLLRLPPDDPASLVRAALVCKLWRRIVADRGFRRRFCELHRRPPMLGYFNLLSRTGTCLTPTSSFHPRNAVFHDRYAIDSRHCRVLLAKSTIFRYIVRSKLAVWDPMSGDLLELPNLPAPQHLDLVPYNCNAAVLCASDHKSRYNKATSLGLKSRQVSRILVGRERKGMKSSAWRNMQRPALARSPRMWVSPLARALLSRPLFARQRFLLGEKGEDKAGMWSETISAAQEPLDPKNLISLERGTLAGNALYFKCFSRLSSGIVKYDLGMHEISWINLPSNYKTYEILLTTTDQGGLGIARVESSWLQLWSREAGPDGHLRWARSRVIELNTVLPANTHLIHVVAFVHGLGAFLVSTDDGVFSVDVDSNRARKVCEKRCGTNVVPYIWFCTPAPDVDPTNTGEGRGASAPSA